jgi:CubicO group peptidase (beta-lactamase class C family)
MPFALSLAMACLHAQSGNRGYFMHPKIVLSFSLITPDWVRYRYRAVQTLRKEIKVENPNSLIRQITTLILLIVAFITTDILGQQNVTARPGPAADELVRKANAFLSQWEKNDMPGCSVGVVKDGRLVYKRGFGMANLDYDVPNTPTTRFHLASVSKPFTAFSIALLAQQGKLSLDDDIRKHVPEMPKYEETITIRHLIHHTSGIREYEALVRFGGLDTDKAYSPNGILNMLARQKNLNFKPGAKYQYSNSGYFLMGLIVQRVSGKSLRSFADENIFKPLGMKNTLIFDNRFEVIKNRAHGYQVGPDKSIRARSSLNDFVGATGVLSTVEDLYLWDQNFHEPKVGNKELISMITTPGTFNSGEKMDYAFGMWQDKYRGLPLIMHSGNINSGYRARIHSFPQQKFAVIALCNNTAILPSVIADKLTDIYLEGQLKLEVPSQDRVPEALPPAIALTEKEASLYAGVYASTETGTVFKLTLANGNLIYTAPPKSGPVTAISKNRFAMVLDTDNYELVPAFNQSGTISEMKLIRNGGKPDVFVPVTPPLDSPQQLSEYVGTYYGDELDTIYRISQKGNNLILKIAESFEPSLTAAYADFFTGGGGQFNLSFSRTDRGEIAGFDLNLGGERAGAKGFAFKRR